MPEYQPGDILLKMYQIERLLGRGAFGEVYLAIDLEQKQTKRAIKVLRQDYPGMDSHMCAEIQDRFDMEGKLGDALKHP